MVKTAEEAYGMIKEAGYFCSLINARFAKPLDEEALREVARSHRLIVTLEENVVNGGFGEHITRFYNAQGEAVTVLIIAIPDAYVEHGNVDILRSELGIDAKSVAERTTEAYRRLTGERESD